MYTCGRVLKCLRLILVGARRVLSTLVMRRHSTDSHLLHLLPASSRRQHSPTFAENTAANGRAARRVARKVQSSATGLRPMLQSVFRSRSWKKKTLCEIIIFSGRSKPDSFTVRNSCNGVHTMGLYLQEIRQGKWLTTITKSTSLALVEK